MKADRRMMCGLFSSVKNCDFKIGIFCRHLNISGVKENRL